MSLIDHQPKPITSDLVKSLWSYMSKVYNTSVISKANSTEMQVVAQALSMMGIQDKDTFMKNYTTTIGHTIYVPFDIGTPIGGWTLERQIIVCAHEHQHVVQCDADIWAFNWNYLTNQDMRAKYETEAYRSDLEFSMYYHRTLPDLLSVASRLKGYGLGDAHVQVALVTLQSAARMVQRGMVLNQATKTALGVL